MTQEQIDALRAAAEKATPGPWIECGHKRGGCTCGYIWSKPTDSPIAVATIGPWGDEWPEVRVVETADGLGSMRVEAFMKRSDYGEVAPERGKGNAAFIALANPRVILSLLAEREALLRVAEAAGKLDAAAMEAVDADPGAEDWDAVLDASAVYGVAIAALPDAKGDVDAR
jgi:hypothetical protein